MAPPPRHAARRGRPAGVAGPTLRFAVLRLAAAAPTSGAGGPPAAAVPAAAPPVTSVLVMRHCIRSTPEDGITDVPGLEFYNNYSAEPWPAFAAEEYHCLPRGARLAQASGAWFRNHGALPSPLLTVADDCERDRTTAEAFLKGVGQLAYFQVLSLPFHAASGCPRPSRAESADAISEQLAARPPPQPRLTRLTRKLYAALGRGAAGDWTSTPCWVDRNTSYLVGGCYAASQFVERLVMEWGGGMAVGWGHAPVEELAEWLELHSWFRLVTSAVPKLVATDQASILHALLTRLEAGVPGTLVLVGHDTQLDAMSAALGLEWRPKPYPPNSTMPSSVLRFDLEESGTVRSAFYFVANFSEESGVMGRVPAVFSEGPGNRPSDALTLQELGARVRKNSVAECANPFPAEAAEAAAAEAVGKAAAVGAGTEGAAGAAGFPGAEAAPAAPLAAARDIVV